MHGPGPMINLVVNTAGLGIDVLIGTSTTPTVEAAVSEKSRMVEYSDQTHNPQWNVLKLLNEKEFFKWY
jgi:hypothetical protein